MVDLVKQAKQFAVSWVIYNLGLFLGSKFRAWRKKKDARKMGVKKEPSSLNAPGRSFAIVTTAALPWRTGMRRYHGPVMSTTSKSADGLSTEVSAHRKRLMLLT